MLRKIIIPLFLFLFLPYKSFSHGINYSVSIEKAVVIKFTYESGKPMKKAQVSFFAPGEFDKAAFKKYADNNGIVRFTPRKSGEWIIMAKQEGGHVKRVNLKVKPGMTLEKSAASLSFLQKIILAICVIWGFTGTALYFKCRKKR